MTQPWPERAHQISVTVPPQDITGVPLQGLFAVWAEDEMAARQAARVHMRYIMNRIADSLE